MPSPSQLDAAVSEQQNAGKANEYLNDRIDRGTAVPRCAKCGSTAGCNCDEPLKPSDVPDLDFNPLDGMGELFSQSPAPEAPINQRIPVPAGSVIDAVNPSVNQQVRRNPGNDMAVAPQNGQELAAPKCAKCGSTAGCNCNEPLKPSDVPDLDFNPLEGIEDLFVQNTTPVADAVVNPTLQDSTNSLREIDATVSPPVDLQLEWDRSKGMKPVSLNSDNSTTTQIPECVIVIAANADHKIQTDTIRLQDADKASESKTIALSKEEQNSLHAEKNNSESPATSQQSLANKELDKLENKFSHLESKAPPRIEENNRQLNFKSQAAEIQSSTKDMIESISNHISAIVEIKHDLQQKVAVIEKQILTATSERAKPVISEDRLKQISQALKAHAVQNLGSEKTARSMAVKLNRLQNALENTIRKDRQIDIPPAKSTIREVQQNVRELRDSVNRQLNLSLSVRQSLQDQLVKLQHVATQVAEGTRNIKVNPEQLKKLSEIVRNDSYKTLNSDAEVQQILRNTTRVRITLEQPVQTAKNSAIPTEPAIQENIRNRMAVIRQPVKDIMELNRIVINIEISKVTANSRSIPSIDRQNLTDRLAQVMQNINRNRQSTLSAETSERVRILMSFLAEEREISAKMLKELRELLQEQLLSEKDYLKLKADLRKSRRTGIKTEQDQRIRQVAKTRPENRDSKLGQSERKAINTKTNNTISTTQRGPTGTLDVVTAKEDDKPDDIEKLSASY